MSDNFEENDHSVTQGREFDEPLIFEGSIDLEPERYIAEKPFELTRYEYSILKKTDNSELWFNLVAGATAGVIISVIGKSISALIAQQNPTLESWEIAAIVIGVLASILLKWVIKSEDVKKRNKLMKTVDSYFDDNKLRHIHLTKGQGNEN